MLQKKEKDVFIPQHVYQDMKTSFVLTRHGFLQLRVSQFVNHQVL